MEREILFSEKNKKNIIKLPSENGNGYHSTTAGDDIRNCFFLSFSEKMK